MNTAVIISARLSSAHLLTLALGLGAIFLCGRALAGPLDEAGWRRQSVAGAQLGYDARCGVERVAAGGIPARRAAAFSVMLFFVAVTVFLAARTSGETRR